MKAIRIHATGGPEVMRLEEIERPEPGAGQVLIRVEAAGVNYADLHIREGTYLSPTRTPLTLGLEVAGTVVAIGAGVSSLTAGARVAAAVSGGYAEYAVASASSLIPIPDSLDVVHAAALPIQGITAYQLLHDSGQVQAGDTVLVHAAAGGVGTLAVQIAKLLGAGLVIGTASSKAKLDLARRLGADIGIDYTQDDWVQEVLDATNGHGSDVILEMVGGRILVESLECLADFGRIVVFGAASGQSAKIDPAPLMMKNQAIVGYWLSPRFAQPEQIAHAVQELMRFLSTGSLEIVVGHVFPLVDAAEAHRAIATRSTTGKVVLVM